MKDMQRRNADTISTSYWPFNARATEQVDFHVEEMVRIDYM